MLWFYSVSGKQFGPVDDNGLADLVRQGVVRGDTLVWREGMPGWQSYSEAHADGPPALPGPRYGGFWIRFAARVIDSILVGCAGFIVRLPLTAMLGLQALNIAALRGDPTTILDHLPSIIGLAGISGLIQLGIGMAYEVYFVSTRGATLGKMMFDLKVVRPDGSLLTTERAAGRYFAHLLSSATLGVGYIIAAFDEQKRSLHDHIADTRVIISK